MASETGRHDADDSASDRARVDYLARERDVDLDAQPDERLDEPSRAELDDLRALLSDPTLWAEPPASLEDSIVTAIAAESGAARSAEPESKVPVVGQAEAHADGAVVGEARPDTGGVAAAPIDLAEARRSRSARQAKPAHPARRWYTRPAVLAAAAAVAAVALAAVLTLGTASSQRRFDVALAATPLSPGASGTAVMFKTDSGWEIHLTATGLPRLDNGAYYQGWLRNADGVLVPIGTFNEGTDVVMWAGVSPDTFSTLTITKEAADGDQASSGQRVLVGSAVESK